MFQHRQHHYAIKRKKIKQLQEQVAPTKDELCNRLQIAGLHD